MLFTAKCYWPGISESDLQAAVARTVAGQARGPRPIFRGALYLPADELVLCLFESGSKADVKRASEHAGLPCERVIETVWLAPADEDAGALGASEGGTT